MTITKTKIYVAASIVSLATAFGAAALDLSSDERATNKIGRLTTPVMDRFEQCRQENRMCETKREVLDKCLLDKYKAQTRGIEDVMAERSTEKTIFRGSAILVFANALLLGVLAHRRITAAAKGPQPGP